MRKARRSGQRTGSGRSGASWSTTYFAANIWNKTCLSEFFPFDTVCHSFPEYFKLVKNRTCIFRWQYLENLSYGPGPEHGVNQVQGRFKQLSFEMDILRERKIIIRGIFTVFDPDKSAPLFIIIHVGMHPDSDLRAQRLQVKQVFRFHFTGKLCPFLRSDNHQGKKIFVHCAANKRTAVFVFLYRVIKMQHPCMDALPDVMKIWTPDIKWTSFIEQVLEQHKIGNH